MAFSLKRYLKELTIMDIALILLCLITALYLVYHKKSVGGSLIISKDGYIYGRYDLMANQIFEIDEHNTIEIKDGKAAIIFSDCADKRCVKQGFSNSMPIICMPNRLMLEFVNEKDEPKLYLQ